MLEGGLSPAQRQDRRAVPGRDMRRQDRLVKLGAAAHQVVTKDTPMLDPILRMTLYRLVAYPVSARGMGAIVSVVRGTKTKDIPMPWFTWYQKMSQVPESRVMVA